MSAEQSRPQTR